jgi:hypothetical protein
MRWVVLAAALLATGDMACARAAVAVPDDAPRHILVMPDVPDNYRICVVIPAGMLPYPSSMAGVHCETVGAMRWRLGQARDADNQ